MSACHKVEIFTKTVAIFTETVAIFTKRVAKEPQGRVPVPREDPPPCPSLSREGSRMQGGRK
jgi:hypothetical protein